MTDRREFFNTFALVPSYWPVKDIADSLCQVKGICDIQIRTRIGGEWNDGKLNGVLYVPGLRKNLISVGAAADRGVTSNFNHDQVFLSCSNRSIAVGQRMVKDLYLLDIEAIPSHDHSNFSSSAPLSLTAWHQSLGNFHTGAIKQLAQGHHVIGLNIAADQDSAIAPCTGCAKGKSRRLPFPVGGRTRATEIGKLIHSDVEGPLRSTCQERTTSFCSKTIFLVFESSTP
jgi:hypothetical protein